MTLTEEDAASFRGLMAGSIASYARLDELVEPKLPVKYPRDPGYRPPAAENPYNAWYWKTHIAGATSGILAGERVAVKDNICVAGVPMMNGSRVLEGYVPEVDATVVTRILDAGGVIAGKAACEDLCFSAGSHTCATGPIRNPHNPKHSTGGSSGGSAALVAAGEVTMALGGDQGGSIRTPSAWCGVFGLKPTWGLVPMTGGMPISYSVDHCGPMCSSTENVARLLTAIAGPDPHDPRTINAKVGNYMEALGRGWRSRPDDVSETVKLVLLLGEYMHRHYHNRYHAKAQNLCVLLRAAYDKALANCDVLAMPTIPFPATEIPSPDAPREVYVDAALNMQQNTCPFDVSGHPAFTVPCGKVNGLPVGIMLVGRHFEETTVIQAAQALEQAGDWRTR